MYCRNILFIQFFQKVSNRNTSLVMVNSLQNTLLLVVCVFQVENDFGWSEESKLFYFTTREEGGHPLKNEFYKLKILYFSYITHFFIFVFRLC
jgi:hypothetical protein